jgi:hypothetical protein
MKKGTVIVTLGLKKGKPGTFKGVQLLPKSDPRIKAHRMERAMRQFEERFRELRRVTEMTMFSLEDMAAVARAMAKAGTSLENKEATV